MSFESRHIGPSAQERTDIARELGFDSNESIIEAVVPASILSKQPLNLPSAISEPEVLAELRDIAQRNVVRRCAIRSVFIC